MVTKLASPGISAPTGYEGLQRDILLKRKLAEAMLGAKNNYRHGSWTQVLGDWAEAYGGVKLEKQASEKEAELNTKVKTDSDAAIGQLREALASGKPLEEVVSMASTNPFLADSPLTKVLLEGYGERVKNQQGVTGEPMRMKGPDGNWVTVQRDKTGAVRPLDGGFSMAPKIENVNGVATALEEQAPGTVLPQDAEALVIRGPNGEMQQNPLAIGAKTQLAQAGATRVNTSTYVDAQDKSFGKQIPEAIVADLTKSRGDSQKFLEVLPALENAKKALKGGLISGFGANARLDLARFADFAGVGGKSQAEKIANSQTYLRSMGQQMFPILQALRPASDTDLLVAQRMSAGDLSVSPTEMSRAIKAFETSGRASLQRHKSRVRDLQGQYSNNPQLAQGLGTFGVDDSSVPMSAQERAAEILARRRGGR